MTSASLSLTCSSSSREMIWFLVRGLRIGHLSASVKKPMQFSVSPSLAASETVNQIFRWPSRRSGLHN